MARFDFSGWKNDRRRDRTIALMDVHSKHQYKALEQARVIAHADDARQMTALALADCQADIVCLQEVENLEALESFEDNYLYRMTGMNYPQKVWVEGNDGRGIDVALMARDETPDGKKIEIEKVTSHRKKTYGEMGLHTQRLEKIGVEADERIFRRDCLEVDIRVGGRRSTIFVCHFKSMGSPRNGMDGRAYTMPVRLAEARCVRKIIEKKFGSERAPKMRWLVCGDLNDYSERLAITGNKDAGYGFQLHREGTCGFEPLLSDGFSDNLIGRRAPDNRWTFYHSAGPVEDLNYPEAREVRHLVQLDYILASPGLAKSNAKALPDIIRNGQPYRTVFPEGQEIERYPRTGWDRPKASDHCPVAVTLEMG